MPPPRVERRPLPPPRVERRREIPFEITGRRYGPRPRPAYYVVEPD
jgi:hypothetical protein